MPERGLARAWLGTHFGLVLLFLYAPVVVLAVVFRKYVMKGFVEGAVKG